MKAPERQTRTHLTKLLAQQGVNPRKPLGQNFLIDLNLIDYIVAQAELGPDDVVLEVGAGTGSLTANLAAAAGAVVSVEIDPTMYKLAGNAIAGRRNVTLLHCDVLRNKHNFAPIVAEALNAKLGESSTRRLKLVANLPYAVATPVISNLVASELPWERMVVTIQLELAERMTAQPGTGQYGALSAWLQSQCSVEILKRLPPSVFWPRPQVTSAIVRVSPLENPLVPADHRRFFHEFLRDVFLHRRKGLRGVLAGIFRDALDKEHLDRLLADEGIEPQTRAEQMDAAALVSLSQRIGDAIHSKAESPTTACHDSPITIKCNNEQPADCNPEEK